MASSVLVPIQKRSTWDLALEKLSREEQDQITAGGIRKVDALAHLHFDLRGKMDFYASKEWRIGGVKVRAILSRILHWVDKFKEIGDVVVQFDPAHASIPWACFRMILMVTEPMIYLDRPNGGIRLW